MRVRLSWAHFAHELPCVLLFLAFLAAVLTWERDALVLAGLMVVALVVVALLKRLLRQARPRPSGGGASSSSSSSATDNQRLGIGVRGKGDRYGMPSGHSTLAFAFFTYALIWVLRRKHDVERWQRVLGYAVSVPLFVLAPLLVAFQRVHDRHHSVPQVVVGAALGIGLGLAAGLGAHS
jgi:membrane-associated phospholipid phosphatase